MTPMTMSEFKKRQESDIKRLKGALNAGGDTRRREAALARNRLIAAGIIDKKDYKLSEHYR